MTLNSPLISVDTTRPVAPWLGGKRNLAKRICALIDAVSHSTYAEPFIGMGGIFLRRTSRPRAVTHCKICRHATPAQRGRRRERRRRARQPARMLPNRIRQLIAAVTSSQ